ncbi:MAG: putative bifunctional diguanylate cyclase/phosphodiesterase [Porticoccaceae bacterium]
MLRPYLNSIVGRRLFLLFLLAALLPMGGLAVYAYVRVSDMLVEVNDHRLQQDSKALGMSVIQELNWRAQVLKREAMHITGSGDLSEVTPEGFLSLTFRPGVADLTTDQTRHLAYGKIALSLALGDDAGMLLRPELSDRILFARMDMPGIWRNDQVPERYCILDAEYRTLYCTPNFQAPAPTAWPNALSRQNIGSFTWRIGNEAFIGGFWRARLQALYAHPGLVFMVAVPKQSLLHSLRQFSLAFFATATLAFGLALLLALSQIRRQLRPLERLIEGTRALAAGDFSARVAVSNDDELGSVAQSFNHMSDTLRHKFHMLQMLAELDRAILNASEMEYVIQSVLSRIHQAISCDCAGIMRLDDHGGGTLQSACGPHERVGKGWSCQDVTPLLPGNVEQSWYRLEWGDNRPECLRHLSDRRLEQALIFPVRVNERIDSLLILAYAHRIGDLDEIVEASHTLTDRLAVAASNIAWEEKLYHQGHYDALTELPNRVLLRDRVEQALIRADRERTSVAVMLVDLDNFKQINDSLGHSAGDELLVECARRLKAATRQSDTTARLGGDEFVVLLPDLPRGRESTFPDALARKFNDVLAEPMTIAERRVTSVASIGIALYPENASSFEDLLKMADAAMYESKRQQPGSFCFYSSNLNAELLARFELIQDLREAVDKDELLLHYQPKVSTITGCIVGAEALVRWNSPKRGLVPPGRFVSLLDEIGLGNWLGGWVMEQACAQMVEWDRQGLAPIPVSVNLSPLNFLEGDLIARIDNILARHSLDPRRLELEILEATAANESPEIHATLLRLRAMGISIALDDFGTGYSSLAYLTQLPANVLKLDRAFIRNLTTDSRQQSIVERIIALARALDFQVVAEGVEEEDQKTLLSTMGCHLIQGYLISRAVPAREFAFLLRANGPRDLL